MTLPDIVQKLLPADKYTVGRRSGPIRAIVNHRMVGTLPGTTAHFQNPTTRPVSTHFGIGYVNGTLQIHQYVKLDDTAYGNGNYDETGNWDNWGYPTQDINQRTISIEHQDHYNPGSGKGVVNEAIREASIELQAMLLRGDAAELYRAGVRFRDNNTLRDTVLSQLRNIDPGPRTIINHNDIAGRLKPYCWLPWADDTTGFPARYFIDSIRRLNTVVVPVPPADPLVYTKTEYDAAIAAEKAKFDSVLADWKAEDARHVAELNDVIDSITNIIRKIEA